MRLLPDTHVVLWWLMDDDRLAVAVGATIDTEAEVYLSAASAPSTGCSWLKVAANG